MVFNAPLVMRVFMQYAAIYLLSSASFTSSHRSPHHSSRAHEWRAFLQDSWEQNSEGNELYDDWSSQNDNSWNDNGVTWSSPEECARACLDGDQPRICYYQFTLEYYATMGRACELCRPNNTNQLSNKPQCECVEADGFERGMLSINRMLPGPSIQVCENDRIIIDVHNKIEGMEVTLHWHGLWQQGYQYYDGVPFLTQCPIPSGTTFRYQFVASNPGTHFYHSHTGLQKMDGQYGSLIVRQTSSKDPNRPLYDDDLLTHVILLSDWMHEMSIERYPGRVKNNPGQLPNNVLINGKGRWTDPNTNQTTNVQLETFEVEYGKRYRFRMINSFSSVCPAIMSIEGHRLTLVAQDGESVNPATVDTIVSSSGERVDFIVNAYGPKDAYWIQVRATGECGNSKVKPMQVAILRYKGGPTIPYTEQPSYNGGLLKGKVYNHPNATCNVTLPDSICANQLTSSQAVSWDLLKSQPDHRIVLPFQFFSYNNSIRDLFQSSSYKRFIVTVDGDVINSLVDGISFTFPPVPPISQNLGRGQTCNRLSRPPNCTEPCECPHVHHIKKGAVVEVVIYDEVSQPMLMHPFHLHGYAFRLFKVGRFSDNRNITRKDIESVMQDHQKMLDSAQYNLPPGKDTISVPHAGYAIFRFKADNPGWWLFHCHFLYHVMIGMNVVFHVGEKHDLPPVPKNFPQCSSFLPEPSFPN